MFSRYFWRLVYRDSGHASIYRRGYTLRCICRKRESPLLCKHSSVYAVDRTARQLGNNNQVRGPSTSEKKDPGRDMETCIGFILFFPPFAMEQRVMRKCLLTFVHSPAGLGQDFVDVPHHLMSSFSSHSLLQTCYPLTFFLYTIFLRYCLYFPAEISLAFNYTTFNLSTFYFSTYVFQVLHIYLAPSSF
jgi:hypothetical protein